MTLPNGNLRIDRMGEDGLHIMLQDESDEVASPPLSSELSKFLADFSPWN